MHRITIIPSQIHDNRIDLTVEQSHYLHRVIRLPSGGQFQAIDNTGTLYLAAIAAPSARNPPGSAQILQIITPLVDGASRASSPAITLICALPKGNNFDDIVRACTELGVTTIIPALSDRTLLDPSPQKLQRWRKIAQEAAEQSERRTIPTIIEPQGLQSIFSQIADSNYKYLCHARGEHPHLLKLLQSRQLADSPIIIAIGPEGGWTDAEIDRACECGFELVSLGSRILRTITAPIVALSIVTAAIDNQTSC